jgi:hypothetical protein
MKKPTVPVLITSAVGVATIIGMLFSVDSIYARKAWAQEQLAIDSVQNERRSLETEKTLCQVELDFLATLEESVTVQGRVKYLQIRQEVIEKRLLELAAK